MRPGGLKTRRYKTANRGGGFLLLLAGIVLGGGLMAFRQGVFTFPTPLLSIRTAPESTAAPEKGPILQREITLPGRGYFALELGSFDALDSARALSESYQSRGAAGYVLEKNGYRVLAAAYAARADAQAVQTELKARHQVETRVMEIAWPEIKIRLSGRQEQLEAFSDAWDALGQLPDHLFSLSQAVDKKETDAASALPLLLSEKETLSALCSRLRAQFPEGTSREAEKLSWALDSLVSALDAARQAQSAVRLGARIKYCQLQSICLTAALTEGMGV